MTMFDWCSSNDHKNCVRTFRRFTLDPKTRQVVWLDEQLTCECSKRGCKCFVSKAAKKAAAPKRKAKKK